LVNEDSWNELPDNLKAKVKFALKISSFEAINEAMKQDAEAMEYFVNSPKVHVSKLTPEMIEEIKEVGQEEMDKMARDDEFFAQVLESQRTFRKLVEPYADLVRLPYPFAQVDNK
jgi:TRAP-type mannitol/chloroaromatic compound transport system substrate-binding protein